MSTGRVPPRRRKKNRSSLAAAFAVMLIVVAVLLFLFLQGGVSKIIFPPTTTTKTSVTAPGRTQDISITPTPSGKFETIREVTPIPVSLRLTVTPSGTSPFTYAWNFDDGTSSARQTVTHVFLPSCGYNITLKVVDSAGHVTKGDILLLVFHSEGTSGMMAVCPRQGTAGITNVELAGGFYKSNESLTTLMDSSAASAKTVKADSGGSWILDVTGDFAPRVNGTRYTFTTSPSSVKETFLTLEGIKASPTSGEPGDSFTLEGRSYQASTEVSIYLGKVYVGQAKTDSKGSFLASLVVPAALRYAGTYQFTTSPPVLGASATFRIPVSTVTPAAPAPFPWWLLILAAAAAIAIVGFLLWHRRHAVDLEVFQEEVAGPFASSWAVRVWGNRRLAKCRVTYDKAQLRTALSPTDARLEMTLPKGRSLDFRVPATLPISKDAWVVVQDGDKIVRRQRFGSIERADA
jgi:Fe-S cluster assembly iron-binding protein IscA